MVKEALKIQKGEVVDYTATTTIKNGDVVPLTDRVGVALGNAEAGEIISLDLEGVFDIGATNADAIAVGDVLYFDANTRLVTTDDTKGSKAGIALTAKPKDTDGSVYVKIDM